MAFVNAAVHVVTMLLLLCEYSSAQGTGGCNPDPPTTLVSGVGTLPNGACTVNLNKFSRLELVVLKLQC